MLFSFLIELNPTQLKLIFKITGIIKMCLGNSLNFVLKFKKNLFGKSATEAGNNPIAAPSDGQK